LYTDSDPRVKLEIEEVTGNDSNTEAGTAK
jgi:hypothetical protein